MPPQLWPGGCPGDTSKSRTGIGSLAVMIAFRASGEAARRSSRSSRAAAGLTLALVLLMCTTACTDNDRRGVAEEEGPTGRSADPTSSAEPIHVTNAKVREVMERVADGEAVTISILGDSTGDTMDEWVATIARTIAEDHDRSVRYFAWDAVTTAYGPVTIFGEGLSEAPVTVYNGSAPGQGPFYSQSNLPALVPDPSDLIIVNHGHNFTDAPSGAAKEAALVTAAEEQWQNSPAMAIILQNPRTTTPQQQEDNVEAIDRAFADSNYLLIDVASAFRAERALAPLLQPDGVHPNDKGQELWAESVARGLGLS